MLSNDKPESLIEAKAAFTFDLIADKQPPYPTNPVLKDIAKLRKVDFCSDRYVLVFFTHVCQIPNSRSPQALKYLRGMRKWDNDRSELAKGFERFHEEIGGLPIVTSGEIEVGNAFDVDVCLFYWLFDAS